MTPLPSGGREYYLDKILWYKHMNNFFLPISSYQPVSGPWNVFLVKLVSCNCSLSFFDHCTLAPKTLCLLHAAQLFSTAYMITINLKLALYSVYEHEGICVSSPSLASMWVTKLVWNRHN